MTCQTVYLNNKQKNCFIKARKTIVLPEYKQNK